MNEPRKPDDLFAPIPLLEGEIAARILPNGQRVAVVPLTFGRARVILCNQHCEQSVDDLW